MIKMKCFLICIGFSLVNCQILNKNRLNDYNQGGLGANLQDPNQDPNVLNNNPYQNKNYQYQYTSYGGTNILSGNDLTDLYQSYFCPEYWKVFRNSCFRFIKSPKRTWHDAKRICEAYKAELVNVDSFDKQEFITKELIQQNLRQNRYYISARQAGIRNWVNEDNTQLFQKDDTMISYDEYNEYDIEHNFLNLNNPYNPNQFNINRNGTTNIINKNLNITGTNENVNNLNLNQLSYDRLLQKDRLVYGFSPSKDRWVFIPAYDYENNLFICESTELYNPNNIHLIADDKRKYDYGIEVNDVERVPRGPYFIKQPLSITFDTISKKLFNEVVVQCLAGGFPTPTYRWYKEEFVNDILTNIELNPLENDRYIISGGNLIILYPEQAKDQGIYHCVAENEFGRILSESVQINFGFIREFNFDRASETAEMNWGKAIYCDPPAHFPDNIKYYWSRDYFPNFVDEDQRVFVSADGSLYFSAIETVDRANYSCTVQSIDSDTGRNGPFFQLRVRQLSNYQQLIFANTFPKIFPDAPVAGQDIRLECMAFGYPVPFYNWTRRDGVLPRNHYLTNYNRVLVIQNATINDNGEYICTVRNDRKSLQRSVLLNIQMEPNFTIPLKDKIKDYESEVTFICEAFAIPDVNYTWYKNAEQLLLENVDPDKYTIQDNILTIKYLKPEKDDGMYQCKAQNQLRGVYSSAQLRVISMKPSFKKKPLESEIYAIYNGNTTIECEPEAAPRPKITWKKDGNVIGAGGHRRITPMGTLIISQTSRDDEGIYTCVATNIYGSDESSSRLVVLQELRFTQTLRPRIITYIGELLWLSCEVVYDEILDVSFIWTHNEQPIKSDPDLDDRITVDYNTLEIRNISVLDSGDYECVVSTAVNEIRSKANVLVQGPPGAPGGVKVIDIQRSSAVLEWVDGSTNGRPIQFYEILGRTNWNRTWVQIGDMVQALDFDRATGRKRVEVHGLTPWSGYEFSVRAANDLGLGVSSLPSPLFSTLSDKPYRPPRNLGGGGGKIGDLTITWDPLLPQEQNGPGIYYKVFWRLHNKDPEWASKIIKPPPSDDPSKLPGEDLKSAVVHIPGDNYYLEYDVKIQPFNDLGAGPESTPVVIYSAEDMPQVAPQQPIAVGYNSTALNVTWQPVDQRRDNMRGKLIGHRLKYWKNDHAEEDAIYYLSRSTLNWALIVGLEPDTYYLVKVMVYNSAGEGPESEKYLERTYRKAPQKPPSAVHVYGVDPSTVRVVWRYISPAFDEEPVSGYKVRVWESDRDMSTANDTFITLGSKLECYVRNLTPGKTYKLRVLAFSNGGDGRMSSPTHVFKMGNTHAPNHSNNIKYKNSIILSVLLILLFFQ